MTNIEKCKKVKPEKNMEGKEFYGLISKDLYLLARRVVHEVTCDGSNGS